MRNVLIVIDMQNDFVTGALGSEAAQNILQNVRTKIETSMAEKVEVIFTRDTHGENYMQTNEGKHLPVPHCIKGTEGWQICSQLTEGLPLTCQVIDKPTFGYVDWKSIIQSPSSDGKDLQIELVGVCTDICVVSNALILKALYPEARVSVDADCCAGVTKESHEAALLTMKSCQVEVLNEKLWERA